VGNEKGNVVQVEYMSKQQRKKLNFCAEVFARKIALWQNFYKAGKAAFGQTILTLMFEELCERVGCACRLSI
jgi:hypothetical protein